MIRPWKRASATLTPLVLAPWRAPGGLLARPGWRPLTVEGAWLHYQKDQFAWGPLEVLVGSPAALAASPVVDWLRDPPAGGGPVLPAGLVLWPGGTLRLNGPMGRVWVRPHRTRGFETDRLPQLDAEQPPIGSNFGEWQEGAPLDGAPTLWTGSDEAWIGEAAWESESLVLPGLQCTADVTDVNSSPYQQGQAGFLAKLADSSANWDRMYLAPLTWEEWLPRSMRETFGRAVWSGRMWWGAGNSQRASADQTVPALWGMGAPQPWGTTCSDSMSTLTLALPTLPSAFRSWGYDATEGVKITVPGARPTTVEYAVQASVLVTRGPSFEQPHVLRAAAWLTSEQNLAAGEFVTMALPSSPDLTLGFAVENATAAGTCTARLLGKAANITAGPGQPGRFLQAGGAFAAVSAALTSGEVVSGQQRAAHTLQVETDTSLTGLQVRMTLEKA